MIVESYEALFADYGIALVKLFQSAPIKLRSDSKIWQWWNELIGFFIDRQAYQSKPKKDEISLVWGSLGEAWGQTLFFVFLTETIVCSDPYSKRFHFERLLVTRLIVQQCAFHLHRG